MYSLLVHIYILKFLYYVWIHNSHATSSRWIRRLPSSANVKDSGVDLSFFFFLHLFTSWNIAHGVYNKRPFAGNMQPADHRIARQLVLSIRWRYYLILIAMYCVRSASASPHNLLVKRAVFCLLPDLIIIVSQHIKTPLVAMYTFPQEALCASGCTSEQMVGLAWWKLHNSEDGVSSIGNV